jgi:hypothetical protein
LEIFHSSFSFAFNGKSVGYHNSDYGRVPDMFLHDSKDPSEFKGYDPNRGVNGDSISYLLQLTQDVKQNPVRLTRLLVQMAKADLEFVSIFQDLLCAVDLRNTIKVVTKHCLGNDGTSHIQYSHELAKILTRWRDKLANGWGTSWGVPEYGIRERVEPDELAKRCTEAIHGLVAPTVLRFGLRASRSIACARPVVATDPATRWLRMHL